VHQGVQAKNLALSGRMNMVYTSPRSTSAVTAVGDYFDLTIDYLGHTQACWGEGYDYLTPGAVWYTSQTR